MRTYPVVVVFALSVVVLLGGCGPETLPLVHVSGRITQEGEPVSGARVTFMPESGPAAAAETDDDGRFVLSTYVHEDGAVIGHHCVTVTLTQPGVVLVPGQLPTAPPSNEGTVSPRYARAETSGLTADVGSDNNDFAFELLP